MYYMKSISDRVRVLSSMLGSDLEDAVLRILRDKFERRIFKETGMVLSVDDVEIASEGVIIPGDSGVYYNVKFKALSFVPLINEVFEAEIKETVEFGAFASVGPFQGLLHVSQISKEKFFYDKKSKTLTSRIEKKSLKKADELVLKTSTVSLKGSASDTKIGLTMRPLGLGKKEWLEEKKKKEEKKSEKKEEKAEKKEEKK